MKSLSPRYLAGLALTASLALSTSCLRQAGQMAPSDSLTEFLPRLQYSSEWPGSAGAVQSPGLAAICRDMWEFKLKAYPTRATQLGDSRYNGNLTDGSQSGARQRQSVRRQLLSQLRGIDPDRLNASDRMTMNLVERQLVDSMARETRRHDAWNLSSRRGPQVHFLGLATDQPIGTPGERADLLQRWRSMPATIRRTAHNLRLSLGEGRVASRTQIEKVLTQLDILLATPAHKSPLTAPASAGGQWLDLPPGANPVALAAQYLGSAARTEEIRLINLQLLDGLALAKGTPVLLPAADDLLPPAVRGRFLADVWNIVEHDIYPAFREYRNVLATEILPHARPDERPGLLFVPHGEQDYLACIESFTSLPLHPAELHATGEAEIKRINAEMVGLGIELFGPGAVSSIRSLRKQMSGDPALHYTSRAQIRSMAEAAIARMQAALPEAFALLPQAELVVRNVPAHQEAFAPMAYYRGPAPDGSLPGRYFINTFEPTNKPLWEAEALAFHEAVPGHHLQIALANELEGLPMVRRRMGIGAFVEGWALYTESLADEMGLYSDDIQRLGMLSFDAWRSARLVVDTGLHFKGWSRDRAILYLEEHTLGDRHNIETEVDRYIAWPAQALCYKVGQLEILSLRKKAEETLGDRFDLASFHTVLLGNGAVTLPILRTLVDEWLVDMGA